MCCTEFNINTCKSALCQNVVNICVKNIKTDLNLILISAKYVSSAESRTTDSTVWIRRGGASAWTVLVMREADDIGPVPFLSALLVLLALGRDRQEG